MYAVIGSAAASQPWDGRGVAQPGAAAGEPSPDPGLSCRASVGDASQSSSGSGGSEPCSSRTLRTLPQTSTTPWGAPLHPAGRAASVEKRRLESWKTVSRNVAMSTSRSAPRTLPAATSSNGRQPETLPSSRPPRCTFGRSPPATKERGRPLAASGKWPAAAQAAALGGELGLDAPGASAEGRASAGASAGSRGQAKPRARVLLVRCSRTSRTSASK
mmetsp:Transcript_119599/g.371804  ORF Transcript_119599/g.371804 Transcript_119599/m.371804 type:complete len:217 (+) Transcript_119599:3-653(+)